MSRSISCLLLAVGLALGGCHREPKLVHAGDEMPPLPPASGTPVGYILDSSAQLKLSDEQFTKLKQIDDSLSARNDAIDTQLREIETPEEEAPPEKNAPPPIRPKNMAPGSVPTRTTRDAGKLHEARAANNTEAIEKAFALLDATQQAEARKLLAARGIASPKPTPPVAPAPTPEPTPTPEP